MSYDLFFWKQSRPLDLDAQAIYERLNEGATVDGVESLPGDEILERLGRKFPDLDYDAGETLVRTELGSFEVYVGEQYVSVMVYGRPHDPENDIVRIMKDFGCPLYDPQDGVRHDAADGTEVGDLPDFSALTPEQRAAADRIKADYLASFDRRPGCRTASVFLLVASMAGVAVLTGLLSWGLASRAG